MMVAFGGAGFGTAWLVYTLLWKETNPGESAMSSQMKAECDGILRRVSTVKDRVPGVVAMITDRSANIYEGAVGERMLGSGKEMTL
jgi:hypothetical protein